MVLKPREQWLSPSLLAHSRGRSGLTRSGPSRKEWDEVNVNIRFPVAEFRGLFYGPWKNTDVHPQPRMTFCNCNQKLLSILLPKKKHWMDISLCLLNNKNKEWKFILSLKSPSNLFILIIMEFSRLFISCKSSVSFSLSDFNWVFRFVATLTGEKSLK